MVHFTEELTYNKILKTQLAVFGRMNDGLTHPTTNHLT